MIQPYYLLQRLHEAGYGITINLWAEEEEYAVVLWQDGKPVGSGEAVDLTEALRLAGNTLGVSA